MSEETQVTTSETKSPAVRRRLFVAALLSNGGNATQAAIAAGYARRSAENQGYRLMRNDEVQAMLEAEKQKMMTKAGVDADWIVQRLKAEAESDTPANRVKALDLLGKTIGLYAPEKHKLEHEFLIPEFDLDDDGEADPDHA